MRGVTTTASDGLYYAGDTVYLEVEFDKPVVATSGVYLEMSTGLSAATQVRGKLRYVETHSMSFCFFLGGGSKKAVAAMSFCCRSTKSHTHLSSPPTTHHHLPPPLIPTPRRHHPGVLLQWLLQPPLNF